jgi:hypothetical protein
MYGLAEIVKCGTHFTHMGWKAIFQISMRISAGRRGGWGKMVAGIEEEEVLPTSDAEASNRVLMAAISLFC